uniref:Uncharacterized protein n=1 Tax=Coturnix japonica TaxID=93934 RepID=A0A8C2U1Q3_COTJA
MKAAHSSRRLSRSAPGSSSARMYKDCNPGTGGGSSASTVSTAITPAASSAFEDDTGTIPPPRLRLRSQGWLLTAGIWAQSPKCPLLKSTFLSLPATYTSLTCQVLNGMSRFGPPGLSVGQ